MTQAGIEIVRDLITRFFNGHNPDLAAEFFTPDFRWHGGSVGTVEGADAYAQTMRQFFTGLPDAEAIEQDAAQDGDTVTMRFTVQGTHTAELWGIAATGNRVVWDAIMIYHLADGTLGAMNHAAPPRRFTGSELPDRCFPEPFVRLRAG
jgi:predicted ester cyclase